jgi:hypothetical protein
MHMASEVGQWRQRLLDESWTTHRWPSRGGSDSDLLLFCGKRSDSDLNRAVATSASQLPPYLPTLCVHACSQNADYFLVTLPLTKPNQIFVT